jgi:hypothetical protein
MRDLTILERLFGKRLPDLEVQRTLAALKKRGVDPKDPKVKAHLDRVIQKHFPELLPEDLRPRKPLL